MQKSNIFLVFILLVSIDAIPKPSKKSYDKHELSERWLSEWLPSYNVHIVQQMVKDDKLSYFQILKTENKQFDLILRAIRSAMRQQNPHDADPNHWTHKVLVMLSKVNMAGKDEEKKRKLEVINQINNTVCLQAQ